MNQPKKQNRISGNISDTDSLKIYYKQLADSEPLTPEEEQKIWQLVDQINNDAREILYTFSFVLTEHIKLLQNAAGTIMDYFPVSSFPGTADERTIDALPILLAPWSKQISKHCEKLQKAYQCPEEERDEGQIAKLRKKSVKLLLTYPVGREKLQEWYDVARFYRDSYLSSGDDLFAETEYTLVRKLCMSPEMFLEKMKLLDDAFAKLEKYRQQIVTCNLRLVVSIAQHYHSSNVQTSDMIQEGNLGLIRAIDKFDYKLGHRFSTYATWWIKRAVSRAIANQSRVIRLPAHMITAIVRIGKAEQSFLQRNGYMPSDQELADILELPRERISAIKKMACQTISFQSSTNDDSDRNIIENLISDANSIDPMRKMTSQKLMDNLKKAIEDLPEREQQIICLRYGLNNQQPKTLLELSNIFNLTRERIRQIEQRAIQRLRAPGLQSCYQDFFFEH